MSLQCAVAAGSQASRGVFGLRTAGTAVRSVVLVGASHPSETRKIVDCAPRKGPESRTARLVSKGRYEFTVRHEQLSFARTLLSSCGRRAQLEDCREGKRARDLKGWRQD